MMLYNCSAASINVICPRYSDISFGFILYITKIKWVNNSYDFFHFFYLLWIYKIIHEINEIENIGFI